MSKEKETPESGKIVMKSEFFSVKACAVQVSGLVILAIGGAVGSGVGIIIGGVAMIVLFLIGNSMATKLFCSVCNEPLETKKVNECPKCHTKFRAIWERDRTMPMDH